MLPIAACCTGEVVLAAVWRRGKEQGEGRRKETYLSCALDVLGVAGNHTGLGLGVTVVDVGVGVLVGVGRHVGGSFGLWSCCWLVGF